MLLARQAREALRAFRRTHAGQQPIYLDYRVDPRQRYGWDKPAHPELSERVGGCRRAYLELIERLGAYAPQLATIPVEAPADPAVPFWNNRFVTGLDAITLYALPALFGARLYVEVGSGNSTKLVRRSIADNALGTRIISIDPHPRAEVDALCDEVIRTPLETADLAVLDRLQANDILMVDNSHRCFQNSDVTVTFLEILPRLKPGVVVYIDDIYLPWDYPREWADRYYSEQYLLAATLLADRSERYEIVFPGFYVSVVDAEARRAAAGLWRKCGLEGVADMGANGFWMRVAG